MTQVDKAGAVARMNIKEQTGDDNADVSLRELVRDADGPMAFVREGCDNAAQDAWVLASRKFKGKVAAKPEITVRLVEADLSALAAEFDIDHLLDHCSASPHTAAAAARIRKSWRIGALVFQDNICGAYGESEGGLGRIVEGKSPTPYQAIFGGRGTSAKSAGESGVVGSQGHGARSAAMAASGLRTMFIHSKPIDGGQTVLGGQCSLGMHERGGVYYQPTASLCLVDKDGARLSSKDSAAILPHGDVADRILRCFGVEPPEGYGLTVIVLDPVGELADPRRVAAYLLETQLYRIMKTGVTFRLDGGIVLSEATFDEVARRAHKENWGADDEATEADEALRLSRLAAAPQVAALVRDIRKSKPHAVSNGKYALEFDDKTKKALRTAFTKQDGTVYVRVPANPLFGKAKEERGGHVEVAARRSPQKTGCSWHVMVRDGRMHWLPAEGEQRAITLTVAESDDSENAVSKLLRNAEEVTHKEWSPRQAEREGWSRSSAASVIKLFQHGGQRLVSFLTEGERKDVRDVFADLFPMPKKDGPDADKIVVVDKPKRKQSGVGSGGGGGGAAAPRVAPAGVQLEPLGGPLDCHKRKFRLSMDEAASARRAPRSVEIRVAYGYQDPSGAMKGDFKAADVDLTTASVAYDKDAHPGVTWSARGNSIVFHGVRGDFAAVLTVEADADMYMAYEAETVTSNAA
jgi:hypothetical protein